MLTGPVGDAMPLPSRPDPGPGAAESLESYLERTAAIYPTSLRALCNHIDKSAHGQTLAGLLLWPYPHEMSSIAESLSLAVDTVRDMTLHRFRNALGPPSDTRREALSRWAAREWFFIAGSRYCPACLQNSGQWQITWRLPWTVRCDRHGLQLADACPQCGTWPRACDNGVASARSFLDTLWRPATCYSQRAKPLRGTGRAATPCGGDLTAAPRTQIEAAAWSTQVQAALAGQHTQLVGTPTTPRHAIRAWREITALETWLTPGTPPAPRARRLLTPVRSTARASVLLAKASQVVLCESPLEAAGRFLDQAGAAGVRLDSNWFRDRLPEQPSPPVRQLREACLAQTGRFSTRITRRACIDTSLDIWCYSAAQIPPRFWACSIPATLRATPHLGEATKQAFVSLTLAYFLCGSWGQAGQLLGWSEIQGRNRSRHVIGRVQPSQRGKLLEEIRALAARLSHCPPATRFDHLRPTPDTAIAHMAAPICGQGWCPCPKEL